MPRPKKYKSEKDLLEAITRTRDLVLDIKKTCGLTYAEIAQHLSAYPLKPRRVVVSEPMLRQYSSGQKPMGDDRFGSIAEAAFFSGLGGDKCLQYMLFHNPSHNQAIRTMNNRLERERELREKRLEKAIEAFSVAGYTEGELGELIMQIVSRLQFH